MPNQKITDDTAMAAASIDPAADVLPIVDVSAQTNKKTTPNAIAEAALGANFQRSLNVDAALSTTLQSVEVGGTASALKVATTKVQVGTSGSDYVGFYGATPVGYVSITAFSLNFNFNTGSGPQDEALQQLQDQVLEIRNRLVDLGLFGAV